MPGQQIKPEEHSLQGVSSLFPRRPRGQPPTGTSFSVLANSFPVKLSATTIAKYDVEFIPPLPEDAGVTRQKKIMNVRQQLEEKYGAWFFDNTRIYATKQVDDDTVFQVADGTKICLRLGQVYDLKNLDLQHQQQIAHIILQRILRDSQLMRLGRCHYECSDKWQEIKIGVPGFSDLRLWPGYRISIEPAMSGLRLSVDVCHRLLETRTVRVFMDERWELLYSQLTRQRPNLTEEEFSVLFRKNINDELTGRAVLTMYNKRVWRIDYVDFDKTINDTFETDDGKKISFTDYMKERYNVDASSPHPGLLVHLPKIRKMDEGKQRQIFILPELAYLTGYSKAMRSNRKVTKQISDKTRVPGRVRWKMATSVVSRLNQVASQDPEMCPLQINPNPSDVKGRIMDPYKIYLRYGQNCEVHGPADLQRSWGRADFMEQGSPLMSYAVVYEKRSESDAKRMVQGLGEQARKAKIPPKAFNSKPVMIEIEMRRNVPREKCWENTIRHNVLKAGHKFQGVFAVIPAKVSDRESEDIYAAIKKVCSTEKGIVSQCVKGENTGNRHVINGIFKQMFVKLGSIPWKVKFDLPGKVLNLGKPTMLVGMDTNHDRKQKLSTCALVASYDRDFVRYHTNVCYQQLGQEIIDHTKRLFKDAMENFRKVNKMYPLQVIIFRDGVSNTQLEAVHKDEVQQIHAAFNELDCKNTIFEFIVVQKRIVARFINQTNYETVPPGTIVSNVVCSSQFWDFFLVPCSPPPGCTATPTRFIVVHDGLGLNVNTRGMADLEAFTNQLCALYFNWPGPVRVPACVKYAHKLSQQFSQAMHCDGTPNQRLLLSYHFL